jgi:hypothetical protein
VRIAVRDDPAAVVDLDGVFDYLARLDLPFHVYRFQLDFCLGNTRVDPAAKRAHTG